MRKMNRKRLNNKGFTLIELLAVVVILAVVMGIASTSVLSSMNSSRKGSLQNSAESTAQIFQNKYAEAMVTGETTTVLNTYDFTVSGTTIYPITTNVGTALNLSEKSYILGANATAVTITDEKAAVSSSFVAFNGESVVTCLIAQPDGSYYVGQAAEKAAKKTIFGVEITFNGSSASTAQMFACSDEQKSWTK